MLTKFIVGLSPASPYEYRGRCITAVTYFLSTTKSVSRRGYKDFCKAEAEYLVLNRWAKDCICNFLNSLGIGYKRKATNTTETKAGTDLVRRDIRQKDLVNGFVCWLQGDHDYSVNTLRVYSDSAKQYFSYFDDFTQENCRSFISMLDKKGFKPQTIRIRITALERLGEFLKKPIKIKRKEP